MKLGWFIISAWVAVGVYAAVSTFNANSSWRQYQRAAVPSDFTTAVGPQLAAWECPTLDTRLNTLTEPCK